MIILMRGGEVVFILGRIPIDSLYKQTSTTWIPEGASCPGRPFAQQPNTPPWVKIRALFLPTESEHNPTMVELRG